MKPNLGMGTLFQPTENGTKAKGEFTIRREVEVQAGRCVILTESRGLIDSRVTACCNKVDWKELEKWVTGYKDDYKGMRPWKATLNDLELYGAEEEDK